MSFPDAVGIGRTVHGPAVRATAVSRRALPANPADALPPEFGILSEQADADASFPEGFQFAAPALRLRTFAPLRFDGANDTSDLWVKEKALFGTSVNHKIRAGESNFRAAPLRGSDQGLAGYSPVVNSRHRPNRARAIQRLTIVSW